MFPIWRSRKFCFVLTVSQTTNFRLIQSERVCRQLFIFQPFPKQQILDSFKLKEFADHNFKLYENDRKFSKQVENTVGKGETARYEQFLLFPQCFLRTCTADM